jgi:hypothetical protein
LKSTDTSLSLVVSKTFFNSFFEALINNSLIFLIDSLFLVLKTKSANETFGVGTLIARPSSFPFNSGIISPRVLEALVEVGTIDCPADLARLGSL